MGHKIGASNLLRRIAESLRQLLKRLFDNRIDFSRFATHRRPHRTIGIEEVSSKSKHADELQ